MTSPTLITARFDEQERHRLQRAVGPVEIAGFGSDGMIMPGGELRRRLELAARSDIVAVAAKVSRKLED